MSGEAAGLLLFLPVLLLSVVVHEYAHARVAVWQGDPTPAQLGRVTLNPIPHLDLFGSLLIPTFLWLSSAGFVFGWAKPVPVVPRNFRDYRRGDILVSLAGVTANFLLAVALVALTVALVHVGRAAGSGPAGIVGGVERMLRFGIWFNVLLGVFNLIPIPPLDGSHVLYHLLPARLGARYREAGRYGMLFLLALFFLPGLLGVLLWPVEALTGLGNDVISLLT
ncbi:MAG: site-2 protease family protein [Gemmatimonadota bacterium]